MRKFWVKISQSLKISQLRRNCRNCVLEAKYAHNEQPNWEGKTIRACAISVSVLGNGYIENREYFAFKTVLLS